VKSLSCTTLGEKSHRPSRRGSPSSADPDDQRRHFELKSFEIVSKETGEVPATITTINEDVESGNAAAATPGADAVEEAQRTWSTSAKPTA
jgi:hypothetical protein